MASKTTLKDFIDTLPDGDFNWPIESAENVAPVYYGDNQWAKSSTEIGVKRKNGELTIWLDTWDGSDWDTNCEFILPAGECPIAYEKDYSWLEIADYLDNDYGRNHDLWTDYYQWVLERGEDPLGEFFTVSADIKRKERWEFIFTISITGIHVQKARRAGVLHYDHETGIDTLPAHVRQFLTVNKKYEGSYTGLRLDLSSEEFKDAGLRLGVWQACHVEHKVSRSETTVAKELRKAARKVLRAQGAKAA